MQSQSTPSNRSLWTVLKVLKWTASFFKDHGIESGRIDAELLLAHVLGWRRIDLYLRYDQPLSDDELGLFKQLIRRRAAREPVAYILGSKEFWSLNFNVCNHVLIPRPETECLIEITLKLIKQRQATAPLKILELGTGSGIIIIALASEMSDHSYIATDLCLDALKIAKANAGHLIPDKTISWIAGDWFSWIKKEQALFDLILSNPPYIRHNLIGELQPEVCGFEPIAALDGGADGLDCYRSIIPAAGQRLTPGGYLIIEIGFDQRRAIEDISHKCGMFELVRFEKDYAGHDRVAILRAAR